MKKTISIFGFDVETTYRIVDGQVEIDKTSVYGVPPTALDGYDIISHAKDHLQAIQDEQEDLFNEEELDPVKPF